MKMLQKPTDKKRNAVGNMILFALLVALLITVDATSHSYDMIVKVLQKGCVYAVVVVSMNLLNGFTGLFSLGQAGFMLIGAYVYAIFSVDDASRAMVYGFSGEPLIDFRLPIIVSILLAGVAAALFAFLIGLPVLKLKSDYLAIATLGFAEILRTIIQWDKLGRVTNGSFPISNLGTFKDSLSDTPFKKISFVIPFFILAFACIGVIALMIRSTYGRAFKAIRDDEIAAEAMGINLAKHKMQAFLISSFFAGVGGALLAMFQSSLQAKAFTSTMTYEILLIVVIGGIGSITGSILGSFLYIACSEWWLRFLDNEAYIGAFKVPLLRNGFRMVVFSVIIMIVVLFFRKGIMGERELPDLFRKRAKKAKKNVVEEGKADE